MKTCCGSCMCKTRHQEPYSMQGHNPAVARRNLGITPHALKGRGPVCLTKYSDVCSSLLAAACCCGGCHGVTFHVFVHVSGSDSGRVRRRQLEFSQQLGRTLFVGKRRILYLWLLPQLLYERPLEPEALSASKPIEM